MGPLLAQRLEIPFHDLDEIIVQNAQRSIPEIFHLEGEMGFRRREAESIRAMEQEQPAVIACGGGAILRADNRIAMQQSGTRIYLRVPLKILEARLRYKKDRPLLAPDSLADTLAGQLATRESWYQESEIQIDAGDGSPEQVARTIFASWKNQI